MTTVQSPLSASRKTISSKDFNLDMTFRSCGVRLSGGGEARFRICVILALSRSTNGFLSRSSCRMPSSAPHAISKTEICFEPSANFESLGLYPVAIFSHLFLCNCKSSTAKNCSEKAFRFGRQNVKSVNKLIGSTKWL